MNLREELEKQKIKNEILKIEIEREKLESIKKKVMAQGYETLSKQEQTQVKPDAAYIIPNPK